MSDESSKLRGTGFHRAPNADKPKGKNYLFGIGIDKYESFDKLSNAVKDVEEIFEVLKLKYQFDEKNQTLLLNEEATEKNIIKTLHWLASNITPSDNLFIYFSGHGILDRVLDKGFWLPVNAKENERDTYLPNSTIFDYIEAIKSHHTLLMVDSCFSGSLLSKPRSAELKGFEKDASRWAMTSGKNTVVSDGKPGKNSPFALSILECLRNNTSSQFLFSDLAKYVKNQTLKSTRNLQDPIFRRLLTEHDKNGEFVFHLKQDEKEDWAIFQKQNTLAAYQQYLVKYPSGSFINEAQHWVNKLQEDNVWEDAKIKDSVIDYNQYISTYPTGKYVEEATQRMREVDERKAWQNALKKQSITGYREYLNSYPLGKHAHESAQKIEDLIQLEKQNTALRQQANQSVKSQALEEAKAAAAKRTAKIKFDHLIDEAEVASDQKNFKEAIGKYTAAIEAFQPGFSPDIPSIKEKISLAEKTIQFLHHYEIGKAAFDRNDHNKAATEFKKAYQFRKNERVKSLYRQALANSKKPSTAKKQTAPTRSQKISNPSPPKQQGSNSTMIAALLGLVGIIGIGFIAFLLGDTETNIAENIDPISNEIVEAPRQLLGEWTVENRMVDGNFQNYYATYSFKENGQLLVTIDNQIYTYHYAVSLNQISFSSQIFGTIHGSYEFQDNNDLELYLTESIDGYMVNTVYYLTK